MTFSGASADEERLGNIAIAPASHDEAQDLQLARG
jgi:hypothetical protein